MHAVRAEASNWNCKYFDMYFPTDILNICLLSSTPLFNNGNKNFYFLHYHNFHIIPVE
jgi:hypothetical protein